MSQILLGIPSLKRLLLIFILLYLSSCSCSLLEGDEDDSEGNGDGATSSATPPDAPQPLLPLDNAQPTVSNSLISLTAVEIDDGEITIEWTEAEDDITVQNQLQYEVYYSESANLDSIENIRTHGLGRVEVVGASMHEFTGLTIDKAYYFAVIVKDEVGNERAYTMRGPFCGGVGTTGSEYEVCDPGSLQYVHFYPDQEFKVTSSIDLTDTKNWNSGSGFLPIADVEFSGQFEGQGNVITSLYVDRDDAAMFGVIGQSAVVQNLELRDAHVKGASGGAVLAFSLVNNAVVQGVTTSGYVEAPNAAGLIGGLGNDVQIRKSGSKARVRATGGIASGGLVAFAAGDTLSLISECFSTGDVFGSGVTMLGGLVGWIANVNVRIENSYATGNVHNSGEAGGLVGQMYQNAPIEDSYAIGNVHSDLLDAGGLVGDGGGNFFITDSFATGNVSNGSGAVVGTSDLPTTAFFFNHPYNPSNCYDGGNAGCTAISNPTWFYDIQNYDGGGGDLDWDFSSSGAWIMPQTGKYPVLRWQNPNDPIAFPPEFRDGRKIGLSDQGAYRVWGFCGNPGATISFTGPNAPSDTTCNGGTWEVTWDFSGSSEGNIEIEVQQGSDAPVSRTLVKDTTHCDGINNETGTAAIDARFIGAGPHYICNWQQMMRLQAVISNYSKTFVLGDNIDLSSYSATAPIGDLTNSFTGTFDGDGFHAYDFTFSYILAYTGLFGFVNGTIQDFGLENVYVSGTTSAQVGGLAGFLGNGVNLYVTGYVYGASSNVGGISGQGQNLSSSFSTADVVGLDSVGGVQGTIAFSPATISEVYYNGHVKGRLNVGGLVADLSLGGPHVIERSFSTGSVSAALGAAGGFIANASRASISDSYSTAAVYCNSSLGCGGFFGNEFQTATIDRSYSSSRVFAVDKVGGFGGDTDFLTISDSFSMSSVFSEDPIIGNFVAETSTNSTLTNVSTVQLIDFDCVGNVDGASVHCTSLSDRSALLSPSSAIYENWNFTTPVWKFPEGGGLPILDWQDN